jgi:hypothetical protein
MVMKTVKVRELKGWPPQPGGAYLPGAEIPVGGEGIVTEVYFVDDRVTMKETLARHTRIPSKRKAKRLLKSFISL